MSSKSLLALAVGAALLGGCATGPYDYAYSERYQARPVYSYYERPAYRYYDSGSVYYEPGPVYYERPYVEPSSTFGITQYGGGNRSLNEHHE